MEQAKNLGEPKNKQKQVGLKKVGFCDLAGGFQPFFDRFFSPQNNGGRRFEANFEHIFWQIDFCWLVVVFWFHPRFFFFGSSTPPKQLEMRSL